MSSLAYSGGNRLRLCWRRLDNFPVAIAGLHFPDVSVHDEMVNVDHGDYQQDTLGGTKPEQQISLGPAIEQTATESLFQSRAGSPAGTDAWKSADKK